MAAFRICFLFVPLAFLFSCKESVEKTIPSPDVVKRRLLEINNIRILPPGNILECLNKPGDTFIEITIKNISNLDLYYHYYKKIPLWAGACIEYTNYPSTGGCMFFADTSRLIRKGEEFILYTHLWTGGYSNFYEYEFEGIEFKLLISSPNDLSYYFEDNPAKPDYKIVSLYDSRKNYAYPFKFTYWVPNDIFWEYHLLER